VPIFGEVPNVTQAIGSLSVIGSGVLIAIAGPAAAQLRRVRARTRPPSR